MPRAYLQNRLGEAKIKVSLWFPFDYTGNGKPTQQTLKNKVDEKVENKPEVTSACHPCWVVCLSLRAEHQSRGCRILEWPVPVTLAELQTLTKTLSEAISTLRQDSISFEPSPAGECFSKLRFKPSAPNAPVCSLQAMCTCIYRPLHRENSACTWYFVSLHCSASKFNQK